MEASRIIKFGPSGNSESFYSSGHKHTEQAAKWLKDIGLNAFEYSFGRGIIISDETAEKIRVSFNRYNIEISAHAPYYINFANLDDEMIEKSIDYVIQTASAVRAFGGKRIVFHPGSVGKTDRASALEVTKKNFLKLAERIYSTNNSDLYICAESMGKINQIGDYKEICELCKLDKIFTPAIDFGHQNARTLGGLKTTEDYEKILCHIIDVLGKEKADEMHIHFSKIAFSKGGEIKHLTFSDKEFGPEFNPLAEMLKKYDLKPYIICESSGTQAEDALEMKKIYQEIK